MYTLYNAWIIYLNNPMCFDIFYYMISLNVINGVARMDCLDK